MLAIAVTALLTALAALAGWTIATSLKRGWAIARATVAELATVQDGGVSISPAFRPLRGRPVPSQQGYRHQPVRLRPLRRVAAA